MDIQRALRAFPTITDSFVLSFVFFLLSDLHQTLREPNISNLIRVLTSLQFVANSPFDYPAFLFMALVLVNLAAAVIARLNSVREPGILVDAIPLARSALSIEEAKADCILLARELRKSAADHGVKGEVSMDSISKSTVLRRLRPDEVEVLRASVLRAFPAGDRVGVQVHESPLTAALLRACLRVGIPVGGMYHPLQDKMSINPSLGALTQAYVYVHEAFHSFGLGEVESEIGTVQVCMDVKQLDQIPLELLGRYLLFRSAAAYLDGSDALAEVHDEITGLRHGWGGPQSFLLRLRKGKMERQIYEALKTREHLIRR